ncbi:MAG: Crp/Fnr family transcriptional regulator, partial [Gammaproteobacteria bacterium]|nr:Crp/Fnr family transcriptional regulator [Gammaproteobacteria bacterium]
MATNDLNVDQLTKLSLFKDASFEYLQDLVKRCDRRIFKASATVLTPDQNNDKIFCVLSGRLAVHLNNPEGDPITTLGPGHCVGEMSIIEDTSPSAYVVAQEDSELLEIDRETLWTMVQRSHAIAHNLLSVLSSRVRRDNEIIADSRNLLRDFERQQLTDGLTGLHNRTWMDDMFDL